MMKRTTHLIAGILLGALLATFALALSAGVRSSQDPVKLSPRYYKVLLENEQVRVLEYRLKPGEKEPTHSHPAGVVYILGESTLRSTLPDGQAAESSGKAGDAFWRDPLTHSLENIGNREAHALAVELKHPCKP